MSLSDLAPNPDYHFNNLESDRITVNVIGGDPVGIEVRIDFETQNEEIKVNNFPNINFEELNITLKLEFRPGEDGSIDLLRSINEAGEATEFIKLRLWFPHTLSDGMIRKKSEAR